MAAGWAWCASTAGTASAARCTRIPSSRTGDRPAAGRNCGPASTIAVEPMLNLGADDTAVMPDGWTVVTADGSLSAHFEHTVAVTEDGHEILTARR